MNEGIQFLCLLSLSSCFKDLIAHVDVNINVNINHMVRGMFEFERSKLIVIHGSQNEPGWNNVVTDLRDNVLNGYDVYLGMETREIS